MFYGMFDHSKHVVGNFPCVFVCFTISVIDYFLSLFYLTTTKLDFQIVDFFLIFQDSLREQVVFTLSHVHFHTFTLSGQPMQASGLWSSPPGSLSSASPTYSGSKTSQSPSPRKSLTEHLLDWNNVAEQ